MGEDFNFKSNFFKRSRILQVISFLSELFFFFLINLFIYFLAVLGLRCCARAFSSCSKRELLFVAVCGLLIAEASLCCGAQALGAQASVGVVHGLSGCGSRALEHRLSSSVVVAHGLSCFTACGIFLDQGSNPCPLHWQVDS